MPQRRKDCGYQRRAPHRGLVQATGTSQPAHTLPDLQISDERSTEDSSGDGDTSDSTEDLLDGTTRKHPLGTPADPSHTPPAHTPPARISLHTSSHTQCRTRPNRSPQKTEASQDTLEGGLKKPHHQGPTPVLLIFLVFLVLIGLYTLHQALNKAEEERKLKRPPKPIADVYADLKLELQGLSREFHQPKELWLGLLGQLESVMVDEPQQPAIVMFVVPDDSRGIATCLAHRLAKAVQFAFEDTQFIMFDTRTSDHQDLSALLKVELDDSLKGLASAHAAVVHNVESIPGPAAMILHAYCDNENAPFKQAVIFLLAEIPGSYNDLGFSRRLDTLVDSHLGRVWGAGLAEKDVSALVSRTCNTPILVRPERPDRLLALCPL